jgi:type IV pilus assembly protein PilV
VQIIRDKENGFTLVEVLVSLAIMSVGLLMLVGLQATAITGNKSGFGMTVATSLGQQALERLQTLPATTSASLTAGTHTASTDAAIVPNQTVNGVTFTRSYTVATDTPIAGVRTVTMTVSWTDKGSHQVAMTGRYRD